MPHPKWGETPLATVVARPGSALTEDILISWCRDRLGPVKKPTRVVFSDSPLPLDAGARSGGVPCSGRTGRAGNDMSAKSERTRE